VVAALILFALGGLLVWVARRNRGRVQASMSWPEAMGRIISASVREDVTQGDSDTPDSSTFYRVVEYEFEVGGRPYRGKRLAFQDAGYSSWNKASTAMQAFAVGGGVRVYYNPGKPDDCVLERAAHHNNVMLAIGVFLLLAGAGFAIKG
jgi:hypothetical protein